MESATTAAYPNPCRNMDALLGGGHVKMEEAHAGLKQALQQVDEQFTKTNDPRRLAEVAQQGLQQMRADLAVLEEQQGRVEEDSRAGLFARYGHAFEPAPIAAPDWMRNPHDETALRFHAQRHAGLVGAQATSTEDSSATGLGGSLESDDLASAPPDTSSL